MLSHEEQVLRLRDLQDIFKFTYFPITFLKLELPLNFEENIKYFQQELKKVKNKYQSKKINFLQFDSITNQIKNKIIFLKKEIIKINNEIKTEKSFFVFVYGNSEQDLNEKILFLQNKLCQAKFNTNILSSYEITKILKLMWNPYEKPIMKKEFKQKKDNLAQLLQFDNLNFKNNHFKTNDLYYSINTCLLYTSPISKPKI